MLEDAAGWIPGAFRELISELEHLKSLDQRVKTLERKILAWRRDKVLSLKLEAIPGIGALTVSALVAWIGGAKHFKNGRQLAAWRGWYPGSTPSVANRSCSGSVSAVIHTCARCLSTELALRSVPKVHWGALVERTCQEASPQYRRGSFSQQERANRLGAVSTQLIFPRDRRHIAKQLCPSPRTRLVNGSRA